MTNSEHVDLLSRMENVLTDPGFQNELAQVRAKALLQAVGNSESLPSLDLYPISFFPKLSSRLVCS